MFLEAATHKKNSSCTFSFRSSCSLISFRSSRTFFKKYWKVFRSSHTVLKKQEIYSEAAAHFLSRFLHKIYTLCVKIFHNLSIVIKTSMMVIKPKALHIPWLMLLFHQPAQPSYRPLCSGLSYAY